MRSSADVATLYDELDRSDQILSKIDNVVDSFQGQLNDISEEVGQLQRQSESFNVSLRNRQELEQAMHEYL